MQTIAQQLKVTEFPFIIKDRAGNEIYFEEYYEEWWKAEYDANNNQTYYEDSDGYWVKCEWDADNNRLYYEDSDGDISDHRPKEVVVTMEEIAAKLGISVGQLRIKD
jgi:hypothetical protein